MAGGAVVVAGAAARALDDLLFAFRSADATAADRALPLRRIGLEPSATLARLEQAGVIKPGADPSSRYLDERALRTYQTRWQSRAWMAVAAASAIMLFTLGVIVFLVGRR